MGPLKRQKKLEWSMVVVLLSGWLLPLTLIAFIMLSFVSSAINSQLEDTIEMSSDKAVEICEIHLAEAVQASKNATYLSTIENSYQQYLLDGKGQRLYREITNFLNQYYKYNESFVSTMLFFLDNPRQIYYTINAYHANDESMSGYNPIEYFKTHNQNEIIERSHSLGTENEIVHLNGKLYLTRNIVDTYYNPYAILVIELDPERIFNSLGSVWGAQTYEVFIDGVEVLGNSVDSQLNDAQLFEDSGGSSHFNRRNISNVYRSITFGRHTITFLVEIDSQTLINQLSFINNLFWLVIIFVIPLFWLVFRFFRTKVSKPISNLIDASQKIQEGDYGYQIASRVNSEEFAYLIEAYNNMSAELKHQFQRAYLEELATRDASIEALQSQINPHFLSNTLEIINWEARLNGNEKVTMMIEALSTMLSYTMNRNQQKYHNLADELTYIDAYLYIIGHRFGSRIKVENEVDESLLGTEIPRLIVQPILENAVEHGMKDRRTANILIKVEKSDGNMLIHIINDRKLKIAEREKIEALLAEKIDPGNLRGSLGIKNVNKRLKIIYGEDSGLTITGDENQTISTVIIPIEAEGGKLDAS